MALEALRRKRDMWGGAVGGGLAGMAYGVAGEKFSGTQWRVSYRFLEVLHAWSMSKVFCEESRKIVIHA